MHFESILNAVIILFQGLSRLMTSDSSWNVIPQK